MAETVQLKIATVGTQEAAKQTKTLRQQIKELREELATLDTTTDEYSQKLTELGNLMHTQSEITEQARMATQDYGATLGNLTGIASGVVGSIAAVSGAMNLLGANTDDAQEAVKTMTSLIGIMQGLSSLETAEKNFKNLIGKIRLSTEAMRENSAAAKGDAASMAQAATATKAQGVAAATTTKATTLLSVGFRNLGRAITSFMASNPFTLILLGATALITLITHLINKTKEEKKALEELNYEARLTAATAPSAAYGTGETKVSKEGRAKVFADESYLAGVTKERREELEDYQVILQNSLESIKKYGENVTSYMLQEQLLREGLVEDVNDQNQVEKALMDVRRQINGQLLKQYEEQKDAQQNTVDGLETELKLVKKGSKAYDEKSEKLEKEKKILEGYTKQFEDTVSELNAIEDRTVAIDEDTRNKREKKRADDQARWEKAKSDALARIKAQYDLENKLAENAHERGETTDEQYYGRLAEIENGYFDEYTKWAAKYHEKQTEVEMATANHDAAMIAIEKKASAELMKIREWATDPSREISLMSAERERDRALELAARAREDDARVAAAEDQYRKRSLEFEEAWFAEKLALLDRYNRDAARLEREAAIESLRIQEERKRQDMGWIQASYDRSLADENEQYEHDLQMYREQLSNQQEYERKATELTYQHLERLRGLETDYVNDMAQAQSDLADITLQIQQEEFEMEKELFEQRKEMIATYVSAFSTITSSVTSLLSEVQGKFDEGTKEYERIAEAMLIMQTIEGSMAAFVSGVESGLPAPYNFAFGTLLAGLATATGIMSIKNLKSKKLSNSASTATVSNPYQTFVYETGSNIEGNIRDSRCYVVESDITETQDRVSVIEEESIF